MTTKDMLIIKDARGDVIAAQPITSDKSEHSVFIFPAHKDHSLHRVSDVPAALHELKHPEEFKKAINEFVKSDKAKITQTSADELHAKFAPKSKN